MKTNITRVGLIALALGAYVSIFVGTASSTSSRDECTPTSGAPPRTGELATASAPVPSTPPPRAIVEATSSVDSPATPEEDEVATETVAEDAPDPRRITGHVEQAFTTEHVDATWSHDMERTIETAIRAAIPAGSSIAGVDCRSSLCRIDSTHTSVAAFQDFVQRGLLSPDISVARGAMLTDIVGVPEPGAPVVTVAFVARQGHGLPLPTELTP